VTHGESESIFIDTSGTVRLISAEQIDMSKSTNVGSTYSITVADELTITVGKSVLSMKSDGTTGARSSPSPTSLS
jgi:hypothetical protein